MTNEKKIEKNPTKDRLKHKDIITITYYNGCEITKIDIIQFLRNKQNITLIYCKN